MVKVIDGGANGLRLEVKSAPRARLTPRAQDAEKVAREKGLVEAIKKGACAPFSQQVNARLLVVDVHRDFETEADVAVLRSFPFHCRSPKVWLMVKGLNFLGLFPAQDYAVCVPRSAKMPKKLKIHFIFNSLYTPWAPRKIRAGSSQDPGGWLLSTAPGLARQA